MTPLVFFVVVLLTWAVTIPLRIFLRRAGVVDRPNVRSSHTKPTIRGGGVSIVLTLLGFLGLSPTMPNAAALVCSVAFAAVAGISFWDDLKSLGVRIRMGVQAAAALLLVLWLVLPSVSGGHGVVFSLAWIGLGTLWLVGYANVFNFMDGINGLAAMQAITGGAGTAMLGIIAGLDLAHPAVSLSLAIAGAALGFLPFNFPTASVFMGDVGSATLGLAIAFSALWVAHAAGWWLVFPLIALHANFLFDTSITMFRRWRRGEVLYLPHREHFYQLAVRSGLSHASVTLLVAAGQVVVLSAVGLATASASVLYAGLACAVVVLLWGGCFAYWAARFSLHARHS